MATNKQRRESTRANLISAARKCFEQTGFEGTHTDTILELAGISRGAMYHHFPSKKDVFEAVYIEVVEESITYAINAGGRGKSPVEELVEACFGWLELIRNPLIATILIEQGPQVLGWKKAREIEAKSSLPTMIRAVEKANLSNEIKVQSVAITAHLINALLAEMALLSLYNKPKLSIENQEAAIRQFILGLKG
jgi:AcrR family transcriptional regulator